jgi:hypothetical protein
VTGRRVRMVRVARKSVPSAVAFLSRVRCFTVLSVYLLVDQPAANNGCQNLGLRFELAQKGMLRRPE